MNYILFERQETRENLLPLSYTRPVSEIRVGILTIREKWEWHLNSRISWRTEPYLSAKFPRRTGDSNIFINGSILPTGELASAVAELKDGESIFSDGRLIASRKDHKATEFDPETIVNGKEIKAEVLSIEYPWDIFTYNGRAIEDDFKRITRGRTSAELSGTNSIIGDHPVFVEEGCRIENASLNTSGGPIYIGPDAEIMEGALVRGPFALCEGSTLKLGAKIYGPSTIGPQCKVGGEINNSVILGYSNKAHDGFLGNSVIGEWCNIGADSNNSNLKNNYAEVKLWNYREERFIQSGLTFCGLIMGDHSKCGINTMFNTGTVVGVNANIFGSGFPRNFIPSFSWGGAQGFTVYSFNKAMEVAKQVMDRRNLELDGTEIAILQEIFDLTAKYRS